MITIIRENKNAIKENPLLKYAIHNVYFLYVEDVLISAYASSKEPLKLKKEILKLYPEKKVNVLVTVGELTNVERALDGKKKVFDYENMSVLGDPEAEWMLD